MSSKLKVNIKCCTYNQNTIIPHPRLHKKQALIENFTHTLSDCLYTNY